MHPANNPGISPQAARAAGLRRPARSLTPIEGSTWPRCRIEYRHSNLSREEINRFDLYLTDGAAVTLEQGDGAFERVTGERREQKIQVAVRAKRRGE